jgi:ribonuclease R
MRVDLDERKIDFEMAEKTISAPIGRKKRGTETAKPAAAAAKTAAEPAPAKTGRRPAKEKAVEAYRPSDAAAKNAELRKSRELKQALLSEAKSGGKAASGGKTGRSAPDKAPGGKPAKPSKHRKGPPKAGSAPAAKSGGARKPKAKS